jgi:hypothetical protein
METYRAWRDNGSPVDTDGSPILVNEEGEDPSITIDSSSHAETALLHQAVVSSVSNCKSPSRRKSAKKLPFSVNSFTESIGENSSDAGTPLSCPLSCSTPLPNRLLKPEEILKLIENNAPPGYKYAITLVPKETDSLEKVLKNRMTTTSGTSSKKDENPPKRQRISMNGAILTNAEYRAKIAAKIAAKTKEGEERKKKTKSQNKKPKAVKKNGKDFREMMKSMIRESDAGEDTDDDIYKPGEDTTDIPDDLSDDQEFNTANSNHLEQNSEDKEEEDVFDHNLQKKTLDELDDRNVGKFFAIYWTKPKTYYWGKLLKVFAEDVEEDANQAEFQFLKKVENSSDPSLLKWDWPIREDKGIVDAKLCFAAPVSQTLQMLVGKKHI